MSQIHYKLPLDTEIDADIIEWINQYHRTKKGEMVRHAIRYYMSIQGEGEAIKFPTSISTKTTAKETVPMTQKDKNRKERQKPALNRDALK